MTHGDTVEIIGHRGYAANAPENTLVALERAIEAGADAVEFDLHVASCGTPVLFHDVHLGRTTNGVGPVRRRTLDQLRAFDAGSWFSPEFAGTRIPSLQEALDATRGRVGRVYAEVKGFRELEDLDRIVEITRDAGMLDDVLFISLDWAIVDRIAGRGPGVSVGYVVDEADRVDEGLERAVRDGGGLLDFDHRLLLQDPRVAERAHAAGVDTAVWTVDDPETAERMVAMGVRRITTDEVSRLVAWRDARRDGATSVQ